MEILLITIVFPYPVNDGGRSGTFKMIDYLRKENDLTLICLESEPKYEEKLKELWPNVKIITFKNLGAPSPRVNFKGVIKNIINRKKPSKHQLYCQKMLLNTTNLVNLYYPNLVELVQKELKEKSFDLVQVDFIELAPIVKFLPTNISKVFVHHEIRYRRMELEYNTLGRKDTAEEWKIENTKILEIGLLNKFDKVISLTEIDKDILVDAGVETSKVFISPLPVDIKEHPVNQPFEFLNRLVFLGPELHFPNLDGVDWFLTNCWEKLLEQNPNLQFSITGKWSEDIKDLYKHYKNVRFEGFVEDLSTVMEGSIMIIPLRIGSGMRMKILEGASWHVPMISTSVGAEGLPMNNLGNCMIANTAQEFIEAVLKLSKDTALQNKFVDASKILITEGYSIEECGAKRYEILESFLK